MEAGTGSSVNTGTLVYRDEIFESVQLNYFTPAFHDVDIPEVYVWRTRAVGLDTLYTTLIYMAFPSLDISGNSFNFSGMMPAEFEIQEKPHLPSFSHFQYFEYGKFKFYPCSCETNVS